MDTTFSRSAPPSGVRFPPLRALMEVMHPSVLGRSERPVGKFDARARLRQGLGVRLGALATARNRTSEAPRSHRSSYAKLAPGAAATTMLTATVVAPG